LRRTRNSSCVINCISNARGIANFPLRTWLGCVFFRIDRRQCTWSQLAETIAIIFRRELSLFSTPLNDRFSMRLLDKLLYNFLCSLFAHAICVGICSNLHNYPTILCTSDAKCTLQTFCARFFVSVILLIYFVKTWHIYIKIFIDIKNLKFYSFSFFFYFSSIFTFYFYFFFNIYVLFFIKYCFFFKISCWCWRKQDTFAACFFLSYIELP